jgi:hypothetical protein
MELHMSFEQKKCNYIIGGVFCLILSVVIWLGIFLKAEEEEAVKKNKTVMSISEAGKIEQVDFLDDGQSIVRTDKGDFCVYGRFQAMRGSYVIMETRASGRRYLCISNEKYCKRLPE